MCGIAGYSNTFLTEIDNFKIDHRGPDGKGSLKNDNFHLFHSRLSIIDLSSNGIQPLFNEDKNLAIVCNGEIYNYKNLNERLKSEGHIFHSGSDSETILHLFESENRDLEKVLNQLIGMFAFAILDLVTNEVWVARDRLGIKPLYYYQNKNQFAFCSEVDSLATSELFKSSIDETSIFEYFLLGTVPGPNTWFKEIKSLDPGHYIYWKDSQFSIRKYWNLKYVPNFSKTEDQWIIEIENLFGEVVKDHLVSDVPVGSFLSAGIDSSLVSLFAVKADANLTAYTAGFKGQEVDESEESIIIGRKLNINHEVLNIEGDFFNGIKDHFDLNDQPFGIGSGLNLSRVSKLASQYVKVVLSGDGGDELFAGYDRHKPFYEPKIIKYIPKKLRKDIIKLLSKITRKRSLIELDSYLSRPDYLKYLDRIKVIPKEDALNLIHPDLRNKVDLTRYEKNFKIFWEEIGDADLIHKMLYCDLKTTLVDEMLTKSDRFTLHRGIEGRVPFIDHRFVELAFSIPTKFKVKNGYGKWILRKIVEKHLDKNIAFRKKTGFSSPIKGLLSHDIPTRNFIKQSLENLSDVHFLNRDFIESLKKNMNFSTCHPETIFGLVALDIYLNKES